MVPHTFPTGGYIPSQVLDPVVETQAHFKNPINTTGTAREVKPDSDSELCAEACGPLAEVVWDLTLGERSG
jgi:hypothetical protein